MKTTSHKVPSEFGMVYIGDIHVAGTPHDDEQRCLRCGQLLRQVPKGGSQFGLFYPLGTLVEVTKTWQAITLFAAKPTCGRKLR